MKNNNIIDTKYQKEQQIIDKVHNYTKKGQYICYFVYNWYIRVYICVHTQTAPKLVKVTKKKQTKKSTQNPKNASRMQMQCKHVMFDERMRRCLVHIESALSRLGQLLE